MRLSCPSLPMNSTQGLVWLILLGAALDVPSCMGRRDIAENPHASFHSRCSCCSCPAVACAGEGLFTALYAGAQGRSDDSLKHWFDQKTATLGGKDVIDTARDLYGNVARFDFQDVGREVPQVDLPELEAFFQSAVHRRYRRSCAARRAKSARSNMPVNSCPSRHVLLPRRISPGVRPVSN